MTQPHRWQLKLITDQLHAGAVIAYPTEGVWGLGSMPKNQAAVEKILRLKRRSWCRGLILIASHLEQILPYCKPLSTHHLDEMKQNWPGPITYLIPKSERTPWWISGNSDRVAVRITEHRVVKDICNNLGQPLVSTSANPAGKKPATSVSELKLYFANQLDVIVPGQLGGEIGVSEIRDLLTGVVLRKKAAK